VPRGVRLGSILRLQLTSAGIVRGAEEVRVPDDSDARAFSGSRIYLQPSADRFRALGHDAESEAAGPGICGIEAVTIVLDYQFDRRAPIFSVVA